MARHALPVTFSTLAVSASELQQSTSVTAICQLPVFTVSIAVQRIGKHAKQKNWSRLNSVNYSYLNMSKRIVKLFKSIQPEDEDEAPVLTLVYAHTVSVASWPDVVVQGNEGYMMIDANATEASYELCDVYFI